jgi:hypothetical protein
MHAGRAAVARTAGRAAPEVVPLTTTQSTGGRPRQGRRPPGLLNAAHRAQRGRSRTSTGLQPRQVPRPRPATGSWTCLPPPGPARTGDSSAICCTGSTDAWPTPAFPNRSARPQPSRRRGQRSWRSCTPGSPMPTPKAPTGSARPSPATPTASATPSTSVYAPAAQPPGEPVGTSAPANFVEPAPVIVLAGGAELSVPLVSAWL